MGPQTTNEYDELLVAMRRLETLTQDRQVIFPDEPVNIPLLKKWKKKSNTKAY